VLSGRGKEAERNKAIVLCGLLVVLCCAAGCGPKPKPESLPANAASDPCWFEEITTRSGLNFVHEATTSGRYLFSESIGSGGAFFDFDNDGDLDVYLIHNVDPTTPARNRLFRQEPDGRFRDVSDGSGLDVTGYGNGVASGDVNNDSRPDLLITEYDRVRLFLNQGEGRFADVTKAAGLSNPHWSVPAAFFDFDRDGWLDLVIGNYLDFDPTQKCPDAKGQLDFCGPHGFHSTLTRLYRNLGGSPGGDPEIPRFADVTIASGFARSPGKAMQILCADFDGDHWPDVFITDDGLPNRLFVNQRNGTFAEEAVARGLAYTGMGASAANMGIASGDVDGDGLFDLFVPHLAEENHTLWRQGAPGIFHDDTARAGLLNLPGHGTGFGAVLADFDLDGAVDLAVANGLVRRRLAHSKLKVAEGIAPFWKAYADPSQLFANDGAGRFHEISRANPAFCGEGLVGRGLVCGDIDNDGAPDLMIVGIGGPARLFRNRASNRGHWLGVRAIDPALGGRDAYGAEVVVKGQGRTWRRLVQPAYSYASSNDPRALFGLGSVVTIDSVTILWPDGIDEVFPGGPADRYLVLGKGTGHKQTKLP
jgi:enediyne biosynthesis protein E4